MAVSVTVILLKFGRVLLWLIYAWVSIVLVLLFLAFLLLLLGANPDAGFVEWVYRSVERAMAPFRGIFEPVELTDSSTLDISILFAMIVYAFVGIGLHIVGEWVTRQMHAAERASARHQAVSARTPADATSAGPIGASRTFRLTGSEGESASVSLTPFAAGTVIDLSVDGVDPSRTYSVWMENAAAARMNLGSFQPDGSGSARLSLRTTAQLSETRLLGLARMPGPGETTGVDVLATRTG
ncbi:MAG: hypothetical protein ACRDO2_11375 [Nocardioidaceae bacterium]